MLKFIYNYLRSMRLYYGFVTATTVLVGLCLAHGTYNELKLSWTLNDLPWTLRDAALLAMGFFAWGFNQIFSDWCDRKEDAINAPHRPMVTGALKPLPAFAVSAAGLAAIAVAGFLMSPWTLVFLALGGALNIAYSLLKRVPVLNCLVYACAISCCALFAIAGMGERCPTPGEFGFVAVWIVPVHFLMCHNSYYKDVKGDRATGVRTLQTHCPKVADSPQRPGGRGLQHRWPQRNAQHRHCEDHLQGPGQTREPHYLRHRPQGPRYALRHRPHQDSL